MKQYKSLLLTLGLSLSTASQANIIDIDFNSGVDDYGVSQGNLFFTGIDGFEVIFTDDDSTGRWGGQADGVHITNQNYGNSKVGTTDLVLGSFNTGSCGGHSPSGANCHSSGIVAYFNQGATLVSFDDTDDDGTLKALFAYDAWGNLIAQSDFASQIPVVVEAPAGQLIYRVEFDTLAGTAGGANDGTVFTIDNFHAEGVDPDSEIPLPVPVPASALLLIPGLMMLRRKAA